MRRKIFKFISVVLVITFLCQDITWAVTSISPQSAICNLKSIYIPESYGRIDKLANSEWLMANSKKVVLIKDAHCHYEAQKNIAKILDILIRDYKIDLVCVEGASGLVDTSVFQSMPDKKARETASDKFVKKGYLIASEALSISRANELPFTIWGVENRKLYVEDLKLFRQAYNIIEPAERFVKVAKGIIGLLKEKIYNLQLKKFSKNLQEYRENNLGLTEWVKYLGAFIDDSLSFIEGHKNFRLVLKAIRVEEGIDFKKVEEERNVLIMYLQENLPKEEVKKLVERSLLFRLGKISSLDYYSYLIQQITSSISYKSSAINLTRYLHLLKLQCRLDEGRLFEELEAIEERIVHSLSKAKVEEELYEIDKKVGLLDRLVHLKVSMR